MSDWRVPVANVEVGEREIEAVVETYRSGWLSMGPRTEDMEARFAEYTGADHAVAVSNGTAALHLICLAAGLGPGDEVVVPSLTFVATANAIRYTGAEPRFADVAGPLEPWLSVESAERAIGGRTRAIMAMSYGGHPGEIEGLAALAEDRGLTLLEDAAHGLGGGLSGRRLGTFGRAGAFSFFSNKNLPVGEGGLVVTDDEELADRVRLLRSHAMTAPTWQRHREGALGYDVVALGFNYRIDEPRAALAAASLAGLEAANARRRELAGEYDDRLAALDGVAPAMPAREGAISAQHLYTVVLDEPHDRDAIRREMAEARVQTSLHYPPVHRFSIYEGSAASLPATEDYARRAITLPLYPQMSAEQVEIVVGALEAALAKGG